MKEHNLPPWRVDNLYSILVMAFGIAFSTLTLYFSVVGDVREIKQDVAYIKEQNKLVLERYVSLENRYGDIALKLNRLETLQGVK